MSILGNAVVRREDPGFLTGSAAYVDDLLPENALYLAYVRSPYAPPRSMSTKRSLRPALPACLPASMWP